MLCLLLFGFFRDESLRPFTVCLKKPNKYSCCYVCFCLVFLGISRISVSQLCLEKTKQLFLMLCLLLFGFFRNITETIHKKKNHLNK